MIVSGQCTIDREVSFEDDKVNVYVVGSGGREATIAELLSKSKRIGTVYVGPGNGGTDEYAEPTDVVPDLPRCDRFTDFLEEVDIGLVVSGSENDLVKGLGDVVRMHYFPFFGASSAAARFESSKIFAREFMRVRDIPQPEYEIFEGKERLVNHADALRYAQQKFDEGVNGLVIKADGLCGGKGVVVARDYNEFKDGLANIGKHKEAAQSILVEEMLEVVEVSCTVLVNDSGEYTLLPFTQDYKRAGEGDTGLNTGGMGAVTINLPDSLVEAIKDDIIEPTLEGADKMNIPMNNCAVYFGLMITENGPNVLEYNMRLGDPETQVMLPAVADQVDIGNLFLNYASGGSDIPMDLSKVDTHYATVIMAAKGYPGDYTDSEKEPIYGIDEARAIEGVSVTIAGTEYDGVSGAHKVKGSRNINVIGSGATPEEAVKKAYEGVEKIKSDGLFYRKDIGCNLDKIKALGR